MNKQIASQYLLILVFCIFSQKGFTQSYVGEPKLEIIEKFEEIRKITGHLHINYADSVLVINHYHIHDDMFEIHFKFDKEGRCIVQKVITACKTCLSKYLSELLEKDGEWKKINENQYASKFDKYLMIEIPADQSDISLQILQTKWSKESYKVLTGN